MAFFISCGSQKSANKKSSTKLTPHKTVVATSGMRTLRSQYSGGNTPKVSSLLKEAEKYLGTPYKYAGNDSSGLDCSGLVCTVYKEKKIILPRNSSEQSKMGVEISIEKSRPGDLLFFVTSGGTRVSHVGILHTIHPDGEVTFIHSSTSKGVIVSSLNEKYWNKAFLFAKRLPIDEKNK